MPNTEHKSQSGAEDVSHEVTSPATVKHWTLFTLDAIEAEHEGDDGENTARDEGVYPEDIYEYAAGDDSIVFRNKREISSALSEMARQASWFGDEHRAVDRRTDATEWDGPDVRYRYRLTEFGRKVLLDLGVPSQLPNRQKAEYDRELGVKPAHEPGWWIDEPEYELFGDEWDIRDHDWIETEHDRVYFKDEADAGLGEERGYLSIGTKLAEMFEDVTFVLTIGPYRMHHDIGYAIRDPWRRVVQIDIYSPMAMNRSTREMTTAFEDLVHGLRQGLPSVHEEYADSAPDELELPENEE